MPKKITIEELRKRFLNKNYELQDKYIENIWTQRFTYICLKHKDIGVQFVSYENFRKNANNCKFCKSERQSKRQLLDNKTFIDNLKIINSNVLPLEQYINSKTKIKFKCLIDNYEWYATPSSIFKGTGCPKCGGKIPNTTNEFKKRINNNNIILLGEYVNNHTNIKCHCKIHNLDFECTPKTIINGKACPKCNNQYIPNIKEIRNILKEKDCVLISKEYINNKSKLMFVCNKHKNHGIQYITYSGLLKNYGCKYCGIERRANNKRFKPDDFYKSMKKITQDIEFLSNYISYKDKIICKCKKCGYEWSAAPNHLLEGSGCPHCHNSKGEEKISKCLLNYNITYEVQKRFRNCKDKKQLPFDFYLPDYNCCIEYDGEQHFRPIRFKGMKKNEVVNKFKLIQKHDKIKNKYCDDNNIRLIRISYLDFKNINKILYNKLIREK